MKILKIALIVFAVLVLVSGSLYFYNERLNGKVILTKYTVISEDVPESLDGFRLFVISDLHNAPFSTQIIDYINIIMPDSVIFSGDIVQLPDADFDETLKIANVAQNNNIPVIFASGNHETQNASYEEIMRVLKDNSVIRLENQSVYFDSGNEYIYVAGLRDPANNNVSSGVAFDMNKTAEHEFSDKYGYKILLNHRAYLYPELRYCGADLIISGHLHGGVMRLPVIGGIFGHNGKLDFPEYDYGYYQTDDGADLIVSSGCDKNPNKKRWFNPPEVVLITLRHKA